MVTTPPHNSEYEIAPAINIIPILGKLVLGNPGKVEFPSHIEL